jgi:hypothetical protein
MAETLTAMMCTGPFQDRRNVQTDRIFESFVSDLAVWIRPSPVAKSELRADILSPAIELHASMKCSRTEYQLIKPDIDRDSDPVRILKQSTLKDIGTWRDETIQQSTRAIVCLSPSLCRIANGDDDFSNLTLTKPVVVVHSRKEEEQKQLLSFRQPLDIDGSTLSQRERGISSPSSSTSMDSTKSESRAISESAFRRLFHRTSSSRTPTYPILKQGRKHHRRRSSKSKRKESSLADQSYNYDRSEYIEHQRPSRAAYPPSPPRNETRSLASLPEFDPTPQTRRPSQVAADVYRCKSGTYDSSYDNNPTPRQSRPDLAEDHSPASSDESSDRKESISEGRGYDMDHEGTEWHGISNVSVARI